VSNIDKPKILVVNDDAASLLALTSLLEQWADDSNYEVLSARSGQDALREVLRHDFAVILLDVNMPGMDGFETAEAIHQRPRSADIPIIFVTAFLADEIDRLKAYQRGAADFLFTPVIPQVLRAKVQVFVALAMKNDQLKRQAEKLSQRTTELIATNKRLVREMEERRAAERTSSAKDEFLAMLGHELRNPLAASAGALKVLDMPTANPQMAAHAGEIARRQTRHLTRIVDDLLDVRRILSGKVELKKARLDAGKVLRQCCETKQVVDAGAHAWTVDVAPLVVDADVTRLEQVFDNLLHNALKYTPAGGAIAVRARPQDGMAVIELADTGIGILPATLPVIFEALVQGPVSIDRAQGGLGLGLALVRELAAQHGGTVTAASGGAGHGSTFTLRLPLAPECAPDTNPDAAARAA
jgi:signal transduction histidine kinase